jgi:hypothetical protein
VHVSKAVRTLESYHAPSSHSCESSGCYELPNVPCKATSYRPDAEDQVGEQQTLLPPKDVRELAIEGLESRQREEIAGSYPGRGGEGVQLGADGTVRGNYERLVRG